MHKNLAIFSPSLNLKQKIRLLSSGTAPPTLRKPWKVKKCPLAVAKSLFKTCYPLSHPQYASYIVHAAYTVREFSKIRPLALAWYTPIPCSFIASQKIKHPERVIQLYAAFEIPNDGRINFNDFILRSIALLDRSRWDTLIAWPYSFNSRLRRALALAGAIPHPEHIEQAHFILKNYYMKQNSPQGHTVSKELILSCRPKTVILEKIRYTLPLK